MDLHRLRDRRTVGPLEVLEKAAFQERQPRRNLNTGRRFGRRLGSLAPATQAIATRTAVNDRVFLVNASLGLDPDLPEDREAYQARF